jgi:tetratricopeptide (TPR) repeat protein
MTLRTYIEKTLTVLILILLSFKASAQNDINLMLKAKAYIQTGKASQAISILSDAIQEKGSSQLYNERAEALIAVKDYSGAIRDFNQANSLVEHSGDYGLAKIYALKGDATTSLYYLSMNLSSVFKKSEKEIMLEPVFEVLENRSEWRQFWKKEWYNYTEKSVSEIEFLTSKGNIEESRSLLSELNKSYPGNEDGLYSEALISEASGKYDEAVTIALRLTAANPLNEKYLRLLAKAQTGQSNPAGASTTYSKLLEAGIADAQLLVLRADCYRKTRETDKALIDIEKFLDLYPENKNGISMAGKIEVESGDNLKALEYFSLNLKLHPNDPDCYVDRANSYFLSKSWDWAAKDYSMSLDLQPGNPDAWLNKGIALLSSGNVNDACHDFKRSYSLGNQKASSYLSKHCMNR